MGASLKVTLAAVGLSVGSFAASRDAAADELVPVNPDERAASTGFFAEGGAGAVTFLPHVSKEADTGPALDLRVGRDLFSWFSLGVMLAASTHEATVPPPPVDQYFQLYRGAIDARLGGRVNRIAFFAEGGAGAAIISTNIFETVGITSPGKHVSVQFYGGVGLEYQLLNRHYAIGLAADAFIIPQFSSTKAIDSRLYLRYTYGG